MTHNDIYTKFMIEYDKANITSSYPSLTKYEIATILDKAYLALIAQKVTGNNIRKVGFESDVKAVEDIRGLIINVTKDSIANTTSTSNCIRFALPDNMLYYISSMLTINNTRISSVDAYEHKAQTVDLTSHELAAKYKISKTNMPWIDKPIAYIEGSNINVLVDPYENKVDSSGKLDITYIQIPNKFVGSNNTTSFDTTRVFQLSDSMAEELINLAIIMALESVESTRLNTKMQTSTYES